MADMGIEVSGNTCKDPVGDSVDQLISIGELVRELQIDFPDLSISKVRYLEDRGLLAPERTKGKYRKYSKGDVKRLRSILAMQRDEYLPLDVIRRRLDTQASSPAGIVGSETYTAGPTVSLAPDRPVYTLEEFAETLGVDEEFVQSLIEFRLVDIASESGPAFSEGDVDTARICIRLRHYNVEPRHLRLLSSSAEREAGLIEQIATPDLRSGHADRREYGIQTIQELGTLLTQLKRLLLSRELRRVV